MFSRSYSVGFCRALLTLAILCAVPYQGVAAATASIEKMDPARSIHALIPSEVTVESTPAEAQLYAHAAAGKLDRNDLWYAALVACGEHDSAQIAEYQHKFDAWCDEIRDLVNATDTD